MAIRNYSNITNVGTLSAAVGTSETTLPINGGWSNLPAFPFYVIVDRGVATEECMLATGGNATALQVTRGYDGSPASSHGTNATVEVAVLAEFFAKADSHVEASTNVHGLAGGAAVVGTTSTQTVTNKTLNSSVINLAHSTSPAATQAVQVAADAATARDGFVWAKTAGATGAAFKATSSGTTRFTVDADGKVQLNSTTGTDKALSIQQSGTERAFIQNDGTVDFGLQNTGATVDRVTIRNRPTQNALRIKDEGGFNIFTIGTGGNVDASGYVASATALSAGTTLAVTGASTLTGDVTLPLPAAGTTPRLIVNSRTGGQVFNGRNQAGTTTSLIKETGEWNSAEKMFIHNNANPVVAKVSATGNVPSPTTDMYVIDHSDGFLKRYNGSSWVSLIPVTAALGRGYVAGTTWTTDSTTFTTSETVLKSFSFTAVANRTYLAIFDTGFTNTTAATMTWRMRFAAGASVTTAGTEAYVRKVRAHTAGGFDKIEGVAFIGTLPAGQHTVGITGLNDGGTGNILGAADNKGTILIFDITGS